MYGGYQQPGYGAPGYQQPGYQQPGYQQPGYYPPPPQQQGGGNVIVIDNDNNDGTPCQFCGTNTNHITRKKVGGVAFAWGCCLLITTGFFCWLPCCIDGCKDT